MQTVEMKVYGVVYTIKEGTEEFYSVKSLQVIERMVKRVKGYAIRHFESSDLASYLSEQAFKIIEKYDVNKCPNFEAYLTKCLKLKTLTFLKESKIEMYTEVFSAKDTKGGNGETVSFESTLENTYLTENDIEARLRIEDVKSLLVDRDCKILELMYIGYNKSEIGRLLGTSHTSINRAEKRIKKAMQKVYSI